MCTVLVNDKALLGLVFGKREGINDEELSIDIDNKILNDFCSFAYKALKGLPTFITDENKLIQNFYYNDDEAQRYFFIQNGKIYPRYTKDEDFRNYVDNCLLSNISMKWRNLFISLMKVFLEASKNSTL